MFDHWFYNSDTINKDEAEKFVKAIRGEVTDYAPLGIRAGDRKISELFEAIKPPSVEVEKLFDKEKVINSINRMTNVSDAIRGVQFKSNTTEDAVQTYQQAAQLSVGAKVDRMHVELE